MFGTAAEDTRRLLRWSDTHHMLEPIDDDGLREFFERYPPRPYRLRNGDDYPLAELEQVGPSDGLWYLNEVPTTAPKATPRRSNQDDGENCHLWVIDERGRPCISEAPLARLGNGKLHHTNLTGGEAASIGGEAWFDEMPRIYLSGSSGRYPPTQPTHLEDAERLFSAVGFEVFSLGWDEETDRPQRVWHGREPAAQE